MTKPLFEIPAHHLLFNPGSCDRKTYVENLHMEDCEYDLVQQAGRGECLYCCGAERYFLEVKVPPHREKLFGTAGGK